jgi:hypothetical protein
VPRTGEADGGLQEIQKENETYYSLLREALPPGPAREEAFNPSPKPGQSACSTF